MECAVCKLKVDNFTLQPTQRDIPQPTPDKILYPTFEEFDSGIGLLPSAFNGNTPQRNSGFTEYDDFMDRAQGASTPVAERRSPILGKAEEAVVLRIDNVPWVNFILLNQ